VPDFGIRTALSEFGLAVDGKKFKHPDTGNMVLYTSLPMPEQHRIYEEWKQTQQQQQGQQEVRAPQSESDEIKDVDDLKPGDRIRISYPGKGELDFKVQHRSGKGSVTLVEAGKTGAKSVTLRAEDLKRVRVRRMTGGPSQPKPAKPSKKPAVPKPKHWSSVKMDDIYDNDFVVYEHEGERHMGLVVRVEGPEKGAATKFWVTPVDPKTGKPIDPSRRHSFDQKKIEERGAVLVPAAEAPKTKPKELTPEEKAKREKERKEKEEKERAEREEAEKKRKAAVEKMGKTGKPLEKPSDVAEGDVISYHWKGEVYHGRVIEAKGHEFFILPIDPETGRLTSTEYDTFRAHDLKDTDAHKVDSDHAPEDPRQENIREVFEGLTRLEEDPKLYFHRPKDSQLIDMSKIRPSKVRLKGVINGNDLLAQAATGKWGKRDPISLIDNGDGTYTVRDGNSTYTNARLSEWERIPAIVKTKEEWEEHDRKEKERKEKEEKERAERMRSMPLSWSGMGPLFGGPPKPGKKTADDDLRSLIAELRTAYRSEWREWPGYKTLVDEKSDKGIFPADTESTSPDRGQGNLDSVWPVQNSQPREKERALPLPSNHDRKRDKEVGPTTYNKNRRSPPRTLSVPGDEYGHPTKYDYNYVRRRDGVTAFEEGEDELAERIALLPLPKPNQREKNLGPAYSRVLRQWYLRNKSRKKLKQKLKYRTRLKRDPQSKKYRRYYKMYPARYKRRGRSPFGTPAERTKAWREKQDQTSRATGKTPAELKKVREQTPSRTTRTRSPTAPGKRVYADARERLAEVLEMLASDWPANWNTQVKKTEPPEQLDQNYAPSNPGSSVPRKDPEKQKGESLRVPDLPAKPQPGLKWKVRPPAPGGTYPITTVNNPTDGSGKVIPMQWYTQEVNNTQALPDSRQDRYLRNNNDVKVAATLAEVLSRCDSKIKVRSKEYTPELERTDTKNWIWHWRVGDHVVRIQALKRGRATNLPKLNLRVSCSCPFWRWWGPAHWATKEDYQKGVAPGTATYPKIRDPAHWRPVCKHAYAVLEKARDFFVRPAKSPLKKLGLRFSADSAVFIETVTHHDDMAARVARTHQERETIRRVARRYLHEEEN
jgi:hypothetical protein